MKKGRKQRLEKAVYQVNTCLQLQHALLCFSLDQPGQSHIPVKNLGLRHLADSYDVGFLDAPFYNQSDPCILSYTSQLGC